MGFGMTPCTEGAPMTQAGSQWKTSRTRPVKGGGGEYDRGPFVLSLKLPVVISGIKTLLQGTCPICFY